MKAVVLDAILTFLEISSLIAAFVFVLSPSPHWLPLTLGCVLVSFFLGFLRFLLSFTNTLIYLLRNNYANDLPTTREGLSPGE